jgi:4-hydroxy-4-methyl-2-oxoglutarate aldolase
MTDTTNASGQAAVTYPSGLMCDAARQLWGPDRIVGRVASGPWITAASGPVMGSAHTVRVARAHDARSEAMQDWFAAFDHVARGSVVVVEVVGDVRGAVVGDACAHRLAAQGALGLIVDGAVRDYDGIVGSGLPAWVRGTRPDGMLVPLMLIEVGLSIRCGGVAVDPGDLVVADRDGMFSVPSAEAEAVVEVAAEMAAAERRMFELISEGLPIGDAYKRTGRA